MPEPIEPCWSATFSTGLIKTQAFPPGETLCSRSVMDTLDESKYYMIFG